MTEADWKALTTAAERARENAYAPYSSFRVGAALRASGKTFAAANVENASYGLSLCAERGAVAAAVLGGTRAFEALVIATDGEAPTPPCGACRQVLREFAEDLPIRLVARDGSMREVRLTLLFADPFVPTHLRSR